MIDIQDRQKLIGQLALFTDLTPQELEELANLADEVHYHPNEIITKEGEIVNAIFIIVEGIAEVTHETIRDENNKSLLIATLKPGEVIGLNKIGFFSQTGIRTATVTAITPMLLLRITIENINVFLQHHSDFNKEMRDASKRMLQMQLVKAATPFTELSNADIQWLISKIKEKNIDAGEIIFREKDKADSCYLICDGQVDVFVKDAEGKEHSLAHLGKFAIFGEIALLASTHRNASVRALEPTQLLVLKKADFLHLITKNQHATRVMSAMVLERARPFMNKQLVIYQHQTQDGNSIITLKNPANGAYQQLSQEGWFIIQQLNGQRTLHDITKLYAKMFNVNAPNFVYDLIANLLEKGFAVYTYPPKSHKPRILVLSYDAENFFETTGSRFEECFPIQHTANVTWVNVQGIHNIDLINKIADQFKLHPLTVEDILNVKQRAKIEEFNDYIYIVLKSLSWNEKTNKFSIEQISMVFSKHFVITFEESENTLFADSIKEYLHTKQGSHMREHGTDYLVYRLLSLIVDQYFIVLEKLGERIEKIEESILTSPVPQNTRSIYKFKRQMLVLRKIIWPVREVTNHLLQVSNVLVTSFTTVYLRDLYDHVVQAIDTLEGYRDLLGGMLDIYLSSLSNRMNEIMKVLTIISTIFIPITFLTGVFGMNFTEMPLLKSAIGFYIAMFLMLCVVIVMLIYFRGKKWL